MGTATFLRDTGSAWEGLVYRLDPPLPGNWRGANVEMHHPSPGRVTEVAVASRRLSLWRREVVIYPFDAPRLNARGPSWWVRGTLSHKKALRRLGYEVAR